MATANKPLQQTGPAYGFFRHEAIAAGPAAELFRWADRRNKYCYG